METLSNPISNLQVPKPFNLHHHHKPTLLSNHHHHHHPSSAAKTTATSSITTSQQKDNFTPLYSYYSQKRTLSSPPRASIHRRAASGYAAALLDISQGNGTVLRVEKDVRRLLRVVFRSSNKEVKEFMRDEWVEEREKGEVLKELVEKGKFEGNLVNLVKILVDKGNSVLLVKEVLEEYLSVFHQLTVAGVAHGPTTRLAMS